MIISKDMLKKYLNPCEKKFLYCDCGDYIFYSNLYQNENIQCNHTIRDFYDKFQFVKFENFSEINQESYFKNDLLIKNR